MQLYEEILIYLLKNGHVKVVIQPDFDPTVAFESECYQALSQIRSLIRDDTLDDPECFQKIEQLVTIFEEMGSGGGGRHDF